MERAIVTRYQMHTLVNYIEKNPMMVKGKCSEEFTQYDKKKLWLEITKRLNAEGPCKKSVDKWIRSWTDLKSNVKRKSIENRKGLSNSNKTLNPLEKRVLALIHLSDALKINKAPGDDEYQQQIDIFKKAEDQLQKSCSKFSFSGSLLPTMQNSEVKELMQISSEQQPLIDEVFKSEILSLKDEPISDSKESIRDENILEKEVKVKQEPPDEISCETSCSSALEPQNPIIVSVAPVSTTKVRPFPILPDYRETVRLQTLLNDSSTLSSSTHDLHPNNVINTPEETNREISTSNSVNITETEDEPQLQECNHNTDPNLLLTEGRRDYFKANKGKQSIAIKAASALTSMAERNCIVLERIAKAIEIQAVQSVKIATAIEVQAAQSVKQTQLIDQLVNILSKK